MCFLSLHSVYLFQPRKNSAKYYTFTYILMSSACFFFSPTFIRIKFFRQSLVNILKINLSRKSTHLQASSCSMQTVRQAHMMQLTFLKINLSRKSTHLQASSCSMQTVRQSHMMQLTFLFETSQSASKNATLTQCSLYMPLVMKSVT